MSVVVLTRNEEARIARCLEALGDFDQVFVVDSNSGDKTQEIVQHFDVELVNFTWNKRYPKKYQWCLEALDFNHDFVFFVDADEVVRDACIKEISALDFQAAGYFVRGSYVINGRQLRFGLKNNKLALLNRHKMEFPTINDLDCDAMGEIEGHYQPVLKPGFEDENIGQIHAPLDHYACDDWAAWDERHQRYARWEVFMDQNKAWPHETSGARHLMKAVFKALPFRPLIAFCHSYIIKLGFLDGALGYRLASSRYRYYKMIEAYR